MKLQISFDMTDLEKAVAIAQEVYDYADILDIGSLLLLANGIPAIHRFRHIFPEKTLACDTKIVDRGKDAAQLFAKTETNWITVMAGTNKNVIHGACTAAHEYRTKVMLDLIDSKEFGQSALEAKNLGVDALLVHQPYDVDDPLVFLDKWELVRGNTDLPIFVSTPVKRENIEDIVRIEPDGIIIGRSITEADDPKAEAQFFYEVIQQS